ncbi:GTPase Era [Deltaproteobacteria bacterium TL4]
MQTQHCGFIGLLGRPNVGKSTLLNHLIGQKISITSHKPQTTRNRILGIKTQDQSQMIFIDTPGIHDSSKLLNQRIVHYAQNTLRDSDLNVVLIEPVPTNHSKLPQGDQQILTLLAEQLDRTLIVINKIDTAAKDSLMHTLDLCSKLGPFAEIVPVSALKDNNLDKLLKLLMAYLPENPFYFEEDQVTDSSERFLAGEFIREELFRRLDQELPYATAVEVESFQETTKCVKIHSLIYVERDSQKGIVIGKNGESLKQIGTNARKKIERLLGKSVYLSIQVKLLKKWSSNPQHLDALGLQEEHQ